MDVMFAGKPIIGIIGGIGSGKSYVARVLGEMGCFVINSDEQISRAYEQEIVKNTLRQWWGATVFDAGGNVNRRFIAARVFNNADERKRLEDLLHPIIARMRDEEMQRTVLDTKILAYIWDAPLLLEAGLSEQCDAIIFVEASEDERRRRVQQERGWDDSELTRRENLQWPLDKKREAANYIVRNTAGADDVRSQLREVLSRILAGKPDKGAGFGLCGA
jgi:dephospho-CoA kinase